MDEDLVEQVHAYAKRHHTTATALAVSFFASLIAAEAESSFPEVEQV